MADLTIAVAGTVYPVPSSAANTDWAAQQVRFLQALAAVADVAVQRLSSNVTPVGTGANTTEDDLMTYSLPAGTLAVNAQGVRVTAWGTGVSTADDTTLRLYFGATKVLETLLIASEANAWRVTAEILRTGAATQVASAAFLNTPFSGDSIPLTTLVAPSATLSGAVTIKCTGQRASTSVANSIRQLGMIVELIP